MNNYRKQIHCTMTLNERMRLATVSCVYFSKQSSLIPMELQLDVEDHTMDIPPTVMIYKVIAGITMNITHHLD